MNPFAERVLRFTPRAKHGSRKVVVRIHAPSPEENGNWSVRYEIVGPGKRASEKSIWGMDAVQALVSALELIPLDLSMLARELDGKITFLGGEALGFVSKPYT